MGNVPLLTLGFKMCHNLESPSRHKVMLSLRLHAEVVSGTLDCISFVVQKQSCIVPLQENMSLMQYTVFLFALFFPFQQRLFHRCLSCPTKTKMAYFSIKLSKDKVLGDVQTCIDVYTVRLYFTSYQVQKKKNLAVMDQQVSTRLIYRSVYCLHLEAR